MPPVTTPEGGTQPELVNPDAATAATATTAAPPQNDDISQEIQKLALKAGLVAERLRADPTTVDTTAIETELEELKAKMAPLLEEQGRKAKEMQIAALMERVQALEAMPGPRKLEFAGSSTAMQPSSGGKAWDNESFARVLQQGKKGNPKYVQMLYDWHHQNAVETDAKWGTKALAEGCLLYTI
jgi:hypothetical protein